MSMTMGKTTRVFEPANYPETEDAIFGYLDEVILDGDPAQRARAPGTVARSKGMTEIAKRTGVQRQSLYHALSEVGNPTLTAVLDALGLRPWIEREPA